MIKLTKIKLNLILWILLFLLFYSNYTFNSFVFDNRIPFSIAVILMIFIRLYSVRKQAFKWEISTKIFIVSFLYIVILDLVKGLFASALGTTMFVLIIVMINTYNFESIFKQIIKLNKFNNILSLVFLIIPIFFFDPVAARNVLGLRIPYFLSYTSQASLIPALIILPLAIYLLFYTKKYKFYFIILTLAICFGGNAYTAILVAVILFFIIGKFTKFSFIFIPFFLLIVFIVGISAAGSTFFDKTAELRAIFREEKAKNSELVLDWKLERTISSTERFAFYWDQIKCLKQNLLVGSDSIFDFQSLGSLILKFGIRGGFPVLISMSYFFVLFLNELYNYNKKHPEKKYGVVLLYSLIIQAMVYNEMGFYSLYTIALFYIVNKLLREKNKEILQVEIAVTN